MLFVYTSKTFCPPHDLDVGSSRVLRNPQSVELGTGPWNAAQKTDLLVHAAGELHAFHELFEALRVSIAVHRAGGNLLQVRHVLYLSIAARISRKCDAQLALAFAPDLAARESTAMVVSRSMIVKATISSMSVTPRALSASDQPASSRTPLFQL